MLMNKKTALQIIGSSGGIIIIALGVAFIVKANIGIDPWGVFFNAMQMLYMGLKPAFLPGIQFGDSITLVSVVVVISASLILREKIKWLSIIGGVLLGQCVNIWLSLLQNVNGPNWVVSFDSFSINIVSILGLCVGIVILSVGVAITIHYPFILSPVDYLMYAIDVKIKHVPYGVIRVISDVIVTLVGACIIFLLTGGVDQTRIGVGTIVMFLVTGLIIDVFQSKMKRFVLKK